MRILLFACCLPMLGGCAGAIPALHAGASAVAAQAAAAPVAAAAGAAGVGLGVGVLVSDDLKRLSQEARDTQFGTQLAGTFGAYLQDSQTDVKKLMQTAMPAQREVLVVAALQAQSAIAKAQAAYRDRLNLKIDGLGGEEKKFKADMESVIADLRSASDPIQKNAGDRAQAIAASLRLTTDVPQLRSYGPVFLFPFLPNQSITLRGSFPASYGRSGAPELSIGGKSYTAFDYQADSLRFSIPTAAFEAAEPQAIVWKRAELIVPWDRPVLNITTTGELAKFGVEMAVLPQSFGRMTVERRIDELPAVAGESVDLAWGSKHFFKYAAGTWKLRYSRIGGSVKEVESSDLSNPLIRVNSDASSLTVSIYPF